MKYILRVLISGFSLASSLFLTTITFAHTQVQQTFETSIDASASFTYRSKASSPADQPWLINGALMGGEAMPYDQGAMLDDAQLTGRYAYKNRYQVAAKVSTHAHGNEWNLELENIWLAFNASRVMPSSTIEVGKMTTAVTGTVYWHASQSTFSEASLMTDLFFGRHFNDTGVRVMSNYRAITLGAEVWNGDNWPATQIEGAGSLFLHASPSWGAFTLNASTWGMFSKADNRSDTRYTDHAHGGQAITSPISNVFFTGDIATYGLLLGGVYAFPAFALQFDFEWIQQRSDGELSDDNSKADYDNTYDGFRTLMGIDIGKHAFIAQYELLAFENNFKSATSPTLIANSNLTNNSHEPTKFTFAWRWAFMEDLVLRTEYVLDNTNEEEKRTRYMLGIVWNANLFSQ